jgi:hypothetical protein
MKRGHFRDKRFCDDNINLDLEEKVLYTGWIVLAHEKF